MPRTPSLVPSPLLTVASLPEEVLELSEELIDRAQSGL
jgi:hypothetical protein